MGLRSHRHQPRDSRTGQFMSLPWLKQTPVSPTGDSDFESAEKIPTVEILRSRAASAGIDLSDVPDSEVFLVAAERLALAAHGIEPDEIPALGKDLDNHARTELAAELCEQGWSPAQAAVLAATA